MSKLRQLIALQTSNLGVRALARALGLSVGAVSKYLRAAALTKVAAGASGALLGVLLPTIAPGMADRSIANAIPLYRWAGLIPIAGATLSLICLFVYRPFYRQNCRA
jgi:hypothetical protein